MIRPGSLVIVHLINPTEKFWGILQELGVAGVMLRGINVSSFDDWMAQAVRAGGIRRSGLSTMFVPLFRVERIFLDEAVGEVESYRQRFQAAGGGERGAVSGAARRRRGRSRPRCLRRSAGYRRLPRSTPPSSPRPPGSGRSGRGPSRWKMWSRRRRQAGIVEVARARHVDGDDVADAWTGRLPITTTRSASWTASSMSWVTKRIVFSRAARSASARRAACRRVR